VRWDYRAKRLSQRFVLLRREDESDGWILTRLRPMLACVVQIDAHLTRFGRRELSGLEVDDHQAPKPSMEEQEIDARPLVADARATLTTDECEIAPEFHQERLEMEHERRLEIGLGVLVFEAEELKDQRVFHLFVRGDRVVGPRPGTSREHRRLVLGESGPLVELRRNLAVTEPPADFSGGV